MRKKTAQKLLEKVKADYEKISDEFDITRQYQWKEFDKIIRYIKDGDAIADIGCGNGRFFSYVKNVRNVEYVGIDNNKKLIRIAQKKYHEENFLLGDMLDLPLENRSQDTGISIAALHHIPSKKLRRKALSEMHRILKNDGTLIISVWNLYQPKYMKYIWKARIRSLYTFGRYGPRDTFIPWGKTGVLRYYYAYQNNELRKDLAAAGFKILNKYKRNNIIFICKRT